MEHYDSAAKRKIRFPSPVKRLKLTEQTTPEKLYTVTPCSPFKPFVNNGENTRATSPLSPIMSLNQGFANTPSTGINKPVTPSERQMIFTEMDSLRSERDTLTKKNQELMNKIDIIKLSSTSIESNDNKAKFYTGLKWDIFLSVFTFLQTFMSRTPLFSRLSLRNQFFVTLVKLRLDIPFDFLADQCGVPCSTLHVMFWVDLMRAKLNFLIHWPDREIVSRTLPSVFKVKYPRLACIIDCFEIS